MAYQIGEIDVLLKQAPAIDAPNSNYNGFEPSTTTLPKGFKRDVSCRGFQNNTIWERDIEVPMRDGTKLRADAFRPAASQEKVPILMAFSPYGKSGTGCLFLDIAQGRMGIPKERLSGFESWESFDPAEWTVHGYAIVNVDARGIFDSEGIHRWHGIAEGRDGYDTIEFFGKLPWCNGHVALMGNSWLASCQWFIAAERPPHLSCMLPLEGLSDVYRESLCRGGVPHTPFWAFLRNTLFSRNQQEDVVEMIRRYPLMNEYWQDKRAKAHLINVPAYVLASMSTGLHTVGSIRCFEDIPHDKKWLRLHSTQEWHDLYQNTSMEDFKRFLDFYTKGIQNGWEQTPRARISVLRYNQPPLVNVPFKSWPVPDVKSRRLYFSAGGHLFPEASPLSDTVSYRGDVVGQQTDSDTEEAIFTHTFDEQTTLMGASRAILWISCPDHDDLDVFVQLRKADIDGKVLRSVNAPLDHLGVQSEDDVELTNPMVYLGPTGVLRASHRALDPKLSKPHWPAHDHTSLRKIPPGQVVRLEIGLWPAAIQFDKGEKLLLKVAGHPMTLAEFASLRGLFTTDNIGRHILHFGGQHDSRIEIQTVQIT